MEHRESPVKRKLASGETRWVARFTDRNGRRRSAGTFKLKRDAQDAIDAAYGQPTQAEIVGAYVETWLQRYPRSRRTNVTNRSRVYAVLDVQVDGRELQHWALRDLRRRHALELVDHMLRVQGRAVTGVQGILRTLSAMCEDAITDELADVNPFKGARLRGNDVRAVKRPKEARVWTWDQMHRLAANAGTSEPMIRTLADCGLRIGELFALRRSSVGGGVLSVQGSAWEGTITETSREKNHSRQVPIPPSLQQMLREMPTRIDCEWLFPTPNGCLWRYSNWKRQVWDKAVKASGVDARPHDLRHSWITLLSASGVDEADLAQIAGHSVQTMTSVYRHALERSFDDVRQAIG